MVDGGADPIGAYRMRLHGVEAVRGVLGPAPEDWPAVTISRHVGLSADGPQRMDDQEARLAVHGEGWVELRRAEAEARFVKPTPMSDAEMVHPSLAPVAVAWAWWHGWHAFHGGGFVTDAGAWAVVGGKGAGKSSTLGWLAREGYGIVADDILVVSEGRVAAGPRFIDLRSDAAARLEMGEELGVVGARERWRAPTGPVAPETPLLGWIFLAWGPEVAIEPVEGAARLVRLLEQQALPIPPLQPVAFMDLARLPCWQFARPPGLDSLSSIQAMVQRVATG